MEYPQAKRTPAAQLSAPGFGAVVVCVCLPLEGAHVFFACLWSGNPRYRLFTAIADVKTAMTTVKQYAACRTRLSASKACKRLMSQSACSAQHCAVHICHGLLNIIPLWCRASYRSVSEFSEAICPADCFAVALFEVCKRFLSAIYKQSTYL